METNESYSVFHSLGVKPIFISPVAQSMTGTRAVMILRPEKLIVSRDSVSDQTENSLEVQIDQAYYLGEEMQYTVNLAPDLSWTVRDRSQQKKATRFRPGEKAFMTWKIQHAIIFPR